MKKLYSEVGRRGGEYQTGPVECAKRSVPKCFDSAVVQEAASSQGDK